VDARSADRSTYIRASEALPEIGHWKPTGGGVGFARIGAPCGDGNSSVNFLQYVAPQPGSTAKALNMATELSTVKHIILHHAYIDLQAMA
jgi:hypothetical protein